MLAHKLFGFVPLADATDDSTVLQTVGNLKLQKFLHLGHAFTLQHGADADVEFLEVIERDCFLDRLCLIVCHFVGLNGILQLLDLSGYDIILYFREQKRGFVQLLACREQVCAT